MKKKEKTFEKTSGNKHKDFKNVKKIATHFAKEYETPKKWYEELGPDPQDFPKVTDGKLIELKDEAKKCHDADIATYNIKNSKTNSDYQWMKTVMSKGVVSDQVAAYTVLIQDDPVCNLPTIQSLVNMVKVGKNKVYLAVIDTLTELFISDLLIPETKLKAFHERPLSKLDELSSGNSGTRRKYLSFWYFEDQLKEAYTQYVLALNKAAHDSVDVNKEKAINAMYKLLSANPEQEKNLLTNIVNKLGDPSQKVACKTIYCLGQLLHAHPAMKQVVLNEIEKLLFRPNVSSKAQYYGVCFLTQFYLSHEDFEVAKNLIDVYFSFFKACVKKGDVDSRMMSALLMGVNRAYPYAKTEMSKISEHIDTLYKVVHISTFNVSLHTLNLLYQVSDANNALNDRFYSALYKKLLDPNIGTTTHQALLLNLIFRALKKDTNAGRIRAFIKRLLQVASYMQPAMACGILFLIFHVMYKKSNLLATRIKEEVTTNDDGLEHFIDVKEEENDETKENDVAKQNGGHVKQNGDREENEDDEEKEEKPVVDLTEVDKNPEIKQEDSKPDSSWVHANISIKSEFNHAPITSYNPHHRNPRFAGGEFCVYTELLNLQNHFHPTVALFANKILNEDKISYSGDPLKDFTLIRFLERFSFKNPKKVEDLQKPGVNPVFGKRKLYTPKGLKAQSVVSQNYLTANEEKIPVEEMFLYKYLHKKMESRPIKEEKDDEDDFSDTSSVNDDEFEEMLEKMAGMPKKDGDDEDLDYMKDVGNALKKSKKDKQGEESEDSLDDDEDEVGEDEEFDEDGYGFGEDDDEDIPEEETSDLEGEEPSFNKSEFGIENEEEDMDEDDEESMFKDLEDIDDDEASDLEFLDSDDDNESKSKKKKGKGKPKLPQKKGKGKKDDINNLFASADDFASLLDEEPDFMAGTSHAVSNKDKAHVKQLAWEQNRHHWLKGDSKSNKKGKKFKQFNNKKRPNNSKFGNKNKKQKR